MGDDVFKDKPDKACGGQEVHSVAIVKKVCKRCGHQVEVPLTVTECPDCGGEMRAV